MPTEGKPNIDLQVKQILIRLKQNAQRIEQEYKETEPCVRGAEEILRKVSGGPL